LLEVEAERAKRRQIELAGTRPSQAEIADLQAILPEGAKAQAVTSEALGQQAAALLESETVQAILPERAKGQARDKVGEALGINEFCRLALFVDPRAHSAGGLAGDCRKSAELRKSDSQSSTVLAGWRWLVDFRGFALFYQP